MNHTKKVFKEELDDCTKEFERQLNELNLQMKNLSHQHAVLQNTQKQSSQKHDRLLSLLEQYKQRYHRMQRSYRLEMEGYHTEVKFLQQKLQSLQQVSSERRKAQKREERRHRTTSQPKKGLYGTLAHDNGVNGNYHYENDSLNEEEEEEEAETSNTLSSSSSELFRAFENSEQDSPLRDSQRVAVNRQKKHHPGRISTSPTESSPLHRDDPLHSSEVVGSLNIIPSSIKNMKKKVKSKEVV